MRLLWREYQWFEQMLDSSLTAYVKSPEGFQGIIPTGCPLPDVTTNGQKDEYAELIQRQKLSSSERLLLMIALSRYIHSDIWKKLYIENNPFAIKMEEDFACPTPSSFLFLVAGHSVMRRVELLKLFTGEHILFRKGILDVELKENETEMLRGKLKVPLHFRELLLWDQHLKPRFGPDFPAKEMHSHLEWSDLVLEPFVEGKLNEIDAWLEHGTRIRDTLKIGKHTRPGYRCIFYGPSGTGKTLAATLLGKKHGLPVFRIELSSIISKYVGETSKNLEKVFEMAEDKGWILFFDEGDALFGKRVDNSQSENKSSSYANQEIAFLLQRIEAFNGLIIVATNLLKNMDEAFSRRFENTVSFKPLSVDNALSLWNDFWPEQLQLDSKANIKVMLGQAKLSPASIFNVIHRLSIRAAGQKRDHVSMEEVDVCIKDEVVK